MSLTRSATFATLPYTARGLPIVLGADPKGKNFLYTNGKHVIIKDVEDPMKAEIYAQHSVQVIVAKYSPSGYYIASGDVSGKVRIWDTTQKEHILKAEYQPLSGTIKDLAWSGDSERIIVAGEGREKFGHVFNINTGTSVGEIIGQSKSLNSCDFKSARPFRVVTASEDHTLSFFQGPPFKNGKRISDHTRFVNCVRFTPSGTVFISGGADGKCFIYDGKTGEKQGELGSPAHTGGIYGLSFSPDSKQLLTASADKSCKVWDVDTATMLHQFVMGSTLEDMQVSCLWTGNTLLSVSLSGHINYLDINNPEQPLRIIKGQNKPLTALAVNEARSHIYSASSNGLISVWNAQTSENDMMTGKGHSNQVQSMAITDGTLVTCSMDDTVMFSSTATNTYGESIKLDSQPKALAAAEGGLVVVACIKELVVIRNGRVISSEKISFEPKSVSIQHGQNDVAVGDDASGVHIYTLDADTLAFRTTLSQSGSASSVRYSPDGAVLVVAENKNIMLYQLPDYECKIKSSWSYHSARVTTLAFSPDSQFLASGSIDTNIIVWDVVKQSKVVMVKAAHPLNTVNCLEWLDDNTIISSGQDSNMNLWTFTRQ